MPKLDRMPFNRRAFIRGMLVAGAAVTSSTILIGCTPQSSSSVKWDEETDVVVIGAGGAGLTAAIEATEVGKAKVIVLEKSQAVGGSTSISGGVLQAAGTSYQTKFAKVEGDTPAKHAEFWTKEGEGLNDEKLVKLLAEKAPEGIEWMVKHGLDYVDVYSVSRLPNVDAALNVPRIHVPGGRGTKAQSGTGEIHIAVLHKSAQDLGVDIRLEAPVLSLVVDADKTVSGVKAQIDGKDKFIRAKRGVVIASSGIDHNKEMSKALAPQQLWELETGLCLCAATNTGDGIKMGMSVGADLVGLGGTVGVPAVSMGAASLNQEIEAVPGIWVNKHGMRFVDESAHYAYAMRAVYNQEDHTAWAIFDESVRKLGGAAMGGIWGAWSDDLSKEIESGRVVKGETIEELAKNLGVNATQLELSLNSWNDDMANGKDTLFGTTEGLAVMDQAPYYATRVTSVNLGSVGGLRIDEKAQVIDVNGSPIPHLYAAGMAAGGFIGPYYPGSGTAIASTVVFGRIAGASAAANTGKA